MAPPPRKPLGTPPTAPTTGPQLCEWNAYLRITVQEAAKALGLTLTQMIAFRNEPTLPRWLGLACCEIERRTFKFPLAGAIWVEVNDDGSVSHKKPEPMPRQEFDNLRSKPVTIMLSEPEIAFLDLWIASRFPKQTRSQTARSLILAGLRDPK